MKKRNQQTHLPPACLPAQHVGEHEWSNDGSVAFNDKLWSVSLELAPSDFLIGHGARIAAVTGRGIANLAEVRPARAFQAEILMEHRHHANRAVDFV